MVLCLELTHTELCDNAFRERDMRRAHLGRMVYRMTLAECRRCALIRDNEIDIRTQPLKA